MPDLATFSMPNTLNVDDDSASDTFGLFVAEPLEKGFGNTLGNAMRRVLLSSLDGIAVTAVQIEGVPHEFSTIPHVIEDVTDIVLNFKKVLFDCSGDLPRKLQLKVKKSGVVTAGDIETDGVTTVYNPDQHICTLDKETSFAVEIEINRGRGYASAEENKSDEQPIGVIPIDCVYSPVKRVAFHVSDCRVGQLTDFDRLEIEIWTDGRVHPSDAVKQAGQILSSHISVFTGVNGDVDDDPSKLITNAEDEALLQKMLRNVNELELSVRAQNCLNNANIRYVGELVQRGEGEMMKYRNFGQKSLNELKEKLVDLGLHLGYDVKEEVRIAFERQVEKLKGGI